jgi:pilus assembly protein Flp/PilA
MTALFTRQLIEFLKNEEGPTAVEYALMMALIIVACIGTLTVLGTNSSNTYQKVATTIRTTSS